MFVGVGVGGIQCMPYEGERMFVCVCGGVGVGVGVYNACLTKVLKTHKTSTGRSLFSEVVYGRIKGEKIDRENVGERKRERDK